jgi:MPBQ/MSBQ methyltransferase
LPPDKARPADISNLDAYYSKFMYDCVIAEYYEQSNFHNFGYWTQAAASQKQACENLMGRLTAAVPGQARRVLDVACGKGATTSYLREHLPATEVIGVDVAPALLMTASRYCVDGRFVAMRAERLGFASESFDAVCCVEAAFHFRPRRAFLEEAKRTLAPGGKLIMQDVLHQPASTPERADILPPENHVKDIAEYESLLTRLGYARVQVVDATAECGLAFYTNFLEFLKQEDVLSRFGPDRVRALRVGTRIFARQLAYCVLVFAEKPI